MPSLTVQTARIDSVTFVEAVLETDRPCEIRLETRFDGAVWPPRTAGRVIEGWDADGVTIEAETGRTAVGFATPVVTSDRPLEIVRIEPHETVRAEIEAWIERIERRVEAAESLTEVDSVPAAAEAVAATGGLAAVESLSGEIDRDQRISARLSVVPDELRERLERVDIPTEAFATLATGAGS